MALVEKAFGDIITFTRASGGGRINSLGQYEWVADNVPRLTHDPVTLQPLGLLVEEQRTNLLLQSAAGDAAITFGIGTGITKGAGPVGSGLYGGSSRAGSVAKNAVNGRAQQNANVTAATPYTASIFIRKPPSFNGEYCAFGELAESGGLVIFNPFSGVIAASQANVLAATVTDFGAFWRIAVTRAVAGTMFAVAFFPFYNATGTAAEGSGVGSGYAHLVDGVQLEVGSVATSSIPTAASQVIRAADVCSVNTLSPWYNTLEGTIVVNAIPNDGSGSVRALASISDGTGTNRIQVRHTASTGRGAGLVIAAGVQSCDFLSSSMAWPVGSARKAALSYKANNFAFSCAGEPAQVDTIGAVPVVTLVSIGTGPNSAALNGIIKSITYYPRVIDVQQASA